MSPTWRVLYPFAGPDREADLDTCTKNLLSEHTASSGEALSIEFDDVDLLRGGSDHDLFDEDRRDKYMDYIAEGWYNRVVAAPPCNTFSRALFRDSSLPQPLRDF